MAQSVRPYVEALPVRNTLTTESSKGLSMKQRKEKKVASKTTNKDKNLIKRGNTWTCIIYVYDPIRGKKKPEWHGGYATKAEARAAMVKLQTEANARGPVEISKMTFKQYAQKYIELNKEHWKPTTLERVTHTLRDYGGPINDMQMNKITAEDIERVHLDMKQKGKLSPASVTRYLNTFRTLFNFAERREDISRNPFKRFVMPGAKSAKRTSPTRDELRLLIEKSKGMMIHMAILLAILLGLRRGEVLGLRYSDFDWETKSVHIQRQIAQRYTEDGGVIYGPTELKTERGNRYLSVPAALQAVIQEKQTDAKSEYVVGKMSDTFIHPATLEKDFRAFANILGLHSVRFHDLRHAYGTVCLNAKVPIKVISDTMGHADITTTANIYCDVQELIEAPANTMDDVFGDLLQTD